jgi:hypothetical protein
VARFREKFFSRLIESCNRAASLPAGAGKQKRKAKNGLLQYSLDGADGKENASQRNEAPLRENSVAKYAKGRPILFVSSIRRFV